MRLIELRRSQSAPIGIIITRQQLIPKGNDFHNTYEIKELMTMNAHLTFVTVVQLGSFSAAAKQLHKTPSAISKQIAQLEQQLGVQLFDRTTRVLVVTDAGKIYYERSCDIVRRIEDTKIELMEFSGEPNGLIRLTWANALSCSPITAFLAKFTHQFPKIVFEINVSVDRRNLVEEKFDFAFRQGLLEDSSLVAIKLFDIQTIFCATPEFIAKFGHPKTIHELMDLPLLIPSTIDLAKQLKFVQPEIDWSKFRRLHRGIDLMTFIELCKMDFSATFCFKHMVEAELEQGTLVDITPPMPLPTVPVSLVCKNYQYMPAKHRVFIDAIKEDFCK